MAGILMLNPKAMVVSNQQTTGPLWVFSLQQQPHLDVILEPIPANTVTRWKLETPDLVILDVSLPESQTIKLVKKLREETIVPIMLLTASRSEEFLLYAYEAGIDDHLFKPVSPSLFHAKVKVWLRHMPSIPASALDPIKIGDLSLIPAERKIKVGDTDPVRLSNLEFRLLFVLMNHPGQTMTIEQLYERVWGYSSEADNTMLKNVIYRLRRKIEKNPADPQVIQTVVGVGYKFINQ